MLWQRPVCGDGLGRQRTPWANWGAL